MRTIRAASPGLSLGLALMATAGAGLVATPARADWHGHDWRGHDWHGHYWHGRWYNGGCCWVPPAVVVAPRPYYYAPPPAYYTPPPPVVYAPPVYAAPGVGIGVTIR
jgi:hypothetical protein